MTTKTQGNAMHVLRPNLDLDAFFQTVRAAPQRALLINYEGNWPLDETRPFLAQDQGAEDVFRAVQPPGIGVLVRDEFRTTAADLWLQPASLSLFLTRWHRSGQPEGTS